MGVAAGTLPLSAVAFEPAWSNETSPEEKLELYKVIFDERFARGREFGRLSHQLGANVQAIREDVTDIWYNDLYFRWEEGPAAIAGLTSDTTLFCLQQLARDVRMHVVYRTEHGRSDGQQVIEQAARLLTNYPRSSLAQRMPIDSLLPGQSDQREGQLVSWIIAPLA
jgi:hypothetical protein